MKHKGVYPQNWSDPRMLKNLPSVSGHWFGMGKLKGFLELGLKAWRVGIWLPKVGWWLLVIFPARSHSGGDKQIVDLTWSHFFVSSLLSDKTANPSAHRNIHKAKPTNNQTQPTQSIPTHRPNVSGTSPPQRLDCKSKALEGCRPSLFCGLLRTWGQGALQIQRRLLSHLWWPPPILGEMI